MPYKRTDRVNALLQRELGQVISEELNDPRISFATVTAVETTNDLRTARVHVSVLGDETKGREAMAALDRAKHHLRRIIGERTELRYVPDLVFVEDRSAERAARISSLLREARERPVPPEGSPVPREGRGSPREGRRQSTATDAPDGVLAVDKPEGWTSHDVVAVMRRVLGTKRVGHGGTLDPLATGVLPILAGRATKWVDRLHTAPKVYAALVRFGSETTTDDREGPVRREAPVPGIGRGELDTTLEAFRGEIAQVPPDRSAVKVDGRRAYAIARAGTDVRLEARTVRIDRLTIASWAPPALRILIVCGSGTYIRSLARDIGRALGSAAHLGALRRLAVGALDLGNATDVGRLRAASAAEATALLRPAGDRLLDLDERFRVVTATELLEGWEAA